MRFAGQQPQRPFPHNQPGQQMNAPTAQWHIPQSAQMNGMLYWISSLLVNI